MLTFPFRLTTLILLFVYLLAYAESAPRFKRQLNAQVLGLEMMQLGAAEERLGAQVAEQGAVGGYNQFNNGQVLGFNNGFGR